MRLDAVINTLDGVTSNLRAAEEERAAVLAHLLALEAPLASMASALEHVESGRTRVEASFDDLAGGIGVLVSRLDETAARLGNGEELARDTLALIQAAHLKLDGLIRDVASVAQHEGYTDAVHGELIARARDVTAMIAQLAEFIEVGRAATEEAERVLLRRFVLPSGDGWIVHTDFGFISCDWDDAVLATYLMESGDLERGLRLLLTAVLRDDDVVVDVGANVGIHTVVCANAVGPTGHVYAIEPAPTTCQHLRRTVALNGLEGIVDVIDIAAGAQEQVDAPFHVGARSGHSSLFPLEGAVGTVKVDVRPLDLLVRGRVDLVKIDVEGAELDVLAGMGGLIERNPDLAVIAEFAPLHLGRSNVSVEQWRNAFFAWGWDAFAIDDLTGECVRLDSIDVLLERESTNVLFARPQSRFWNVGALDG